jgi:enoyl-CoA hydratase/carnithine racemase
MMETFVILEHAARDPACKILIWTASGEKAFSSGAALRGDKTVHVPKHAVSDYQKRGMVSPKGDMVLAAQTIAFW